MRNDILNEVKKYDFVNKIVPTLKFLKMLHFQSIFTSLSKVSPIDFFQQDQY